MCAEYQINKQPVEIREWLKRKGESDSDNVYRPRIKLFTVAPIVVGEEFRIEAMKFSLKPPSIKYATFNARLYDDDDDDDERSDRIVAMGEKRTWKKPLAESRCLVLKTGGSYKGFYIIMDQPNCLFKTFIICRMVVG
jgi:putative SOS response-associated peptidase YedK